MLESAITAKIMAYLRKRGGVAIKLHGGIYQTPGILDIYYLEKGVNVWLEVKRPEEKYGVTGLQAAMIKAINLRGGNAYVVHSEEETKEVLKVLGL